MTKRAPLTFSHEKVSPSPLTNAINANASEITSANGSAGKRANTQTKKGRAGRHFVAAHVMPEAAKQFKLLAVQQDRTTQDLLIEAINDLFAKHGLSRIAD